MESMPKDRQASHNPTMQARELALQAVYGVLENGAYSNLILDKLLKKNTLSPGDNKLVTEIVNGTIRMLKHLDWVLNLFVHKPVGGQNPWLRNILRTSLYQIMFMDRIPNYACVNDAVELCRQKAGPGLSKVANGVLRNIIRNLDQVKYPEQNQPVPYLAVYYSQPEWLVEKLLSDLGRADTEKILAYFNQKPSLTMRTNRLKGSRDRLAELLAAEGIKCHASPLIPDAIVVDHLNRPLAESGSYREGWFYMQNEAAMLAASILSPRPGDRVIDLCCGLGGKSTQMAEMMDNQGQIHAYDIYPHKLSLLEINCRRLGINIVKACNHDVLQLDAPVSGFKVMLDAPCSGLGVLNRRADSRWAKTQQTIDSLKDLQAELIQRAGSLTVPGGVLVYTTCTINREENEDIINGFLSSSNQFKLESFDREIGFFPLDAHDRNRAHQGMLTIYPGKYGTDGMFYARLRKER